MEVAIHLSDDVAAAVPWDEAGQFPELGAGERDAIALAHELQAPLLLMDDPDRREEAAR